MLSPITTNFMDQILLKEEIPTIWDEPHDADDSGEKLLVTEVKRAVGMYGHSAAFLCAVIYDE